jgi:hypothetical protein
MRGILHDFTPNILYDITGYVGNVPHAEGQGVAQILNRRDTGCIEETFFEYVPTIKGTVISYESHACTDPKIHRSSMDTRSNTDLELWLGYFLRQG